MKPPKPNRILSCLFLAVATACVVSTPAFAAGSWHEPVYVATTESISHSGLPTIDGVYVSAGKSVLDKDNSTASLRGVWVVGPAAWARRGDSNSGFNMTTGATYKVQRGTVNSGKEFTLTTAAPIVLGTTSLTFTDTTGGSGAFSAISGGTNTSAAMVVGTGGSLAATGSGTITATGLKSATTTVAVGAATAPSSGQVLTATSDSAATWQTPTGGSLYPSETSITANGDQNISSYDTHYKISSVSASSILTLPTAVGHSGEFIHIRDVSNTISPTTSTLAANAYLVSLAPQSGQTIAGLPANYRYLFVRNWQEITLTSDGSNWALYSSNCDVTVDPRSVSNLFGWWSGRYGLTITANAKMQVSSWADISGNAKTLTQNGGDGGYFAGPRSGYSSGVYIDANGYTAGVQPQNAGSLSVIVSGATHAGNVYNGVFSTSYAGASGLSMYRTASALGDYNAGEWVLWGDGYNSGRAPRVSGYAVPSYASDDSSPFVVVGRMSAGAVSMRLNGSESKRLAITGAVPSSNQILYVGTDIYPAGSAFRGLLHDVLMFNAYVSDADVALIEKTLSAAQKIR